MLITGVTSGLGKFLHRQYPKATTYIRNGPLFKEHHHVIIHCAHDREAQENNTKMLSNLLQMPHEVFVYISSVDVYGDRGAGKLHCEEIVKLRAVNYLIIRSGALLGVDMRPNSLSKIFNGGDITLSGDSTFGYATHQTVHKIIADAINAPIANYNRTIHALGNPISLQAVATSFDITREFGDHKYETPEIPCGIDSMEEIEEYLAYLQIHGAKYDIEGDI